MQIETKNVKLLCVEVPMEAHTFSTCGYSKPFLLEYKYKQLEEDFDIEIECRASILGTITNGVLDFDAEPYVDSGFIVDPYSSMNMVKKHPAADSFLSLLTYQSIPYTNKKIVCLKIK